MAVRATVTTEQLAEIMYNGITNYGQACAQDIREALASSDAWGRDLASAGVFRLNTGDACEQIATAAEAQELVPELVERVEARLDELAGMAAK